MHLHSLSIQVTCFWTQMSPLALKYVLHFWSIQVISFGFKINTFACKFPFTLIQINLIGFKCAFVPSIHSSHINLNLNEPSFSQMYFCTFKSCPLQLYCTLAPSNHSNQNLYNSNMYFTYHITQIKPSLTPKCPSLSKCTFPKKKVHDFNTIPNEEICLLSKI
jgi:hypothetical protein